MKLLGDKIIVEFSNESIESIYRGKEITRNDGSKVRLFIATPAHDDEDRKSGLTVNTAFVTHVSDDVKDIQVGDLAIVNYDLFNAKNNLIENRGGDGISFWINASTTYHNSTHIAYANKKSKRDQIVYESGDIDEMSFLLGIIRDGTLIARSPIVFIDHTNIEVDRVTGSGLVYTEKLKTFSRRVLGISPEATEKKGISEGDMILVADYDIFEIKMDYYGKSIDAIYERDIIGKVVKGAKYPIPV
jgi:hypothetical protein